jgi:3-oxoadipate enol-lactonase
MFALINHLTLHYQVDGQPDGIPLVFINSLGCDLRIWEPLIPPFKGDFRIIRYDQRGHGKSDTSPGPYTIRDHSNDLAALLADLGIDQAILVGSSVGGLIALDFALAQPAAVRALVLSDTAPKIGTTELWNERILAVQERGLDGMAEIILRRWFTPSFIEKHPAKYREILNMLLQTPLDGYIATCAALRDTELRDPILRTIQVPTLVLCGAEDQVVTPEQTLTWAAHLRQARVEIIAGAAHLPCIEQPAIMAKLIEKFLREDCHAWG